MKSKNLLRLILFFEIVWFVIFLNGCFLFPANPSKSQLHKLLDSCILNAPGCGIPLNQVEVTANTPEINIQESNIDYPSNSSFDFGSMPALDPAVNKTFTIQNLGTASLTLTETSQDLGSASVRAIATSIVAINGTNASEFIVTQQPTATSLDSGGSTTFIISFTAVSVGAKTASLSISNNDTNENPYTINLQGTGATPK